MGKLIVKEKEIVVPGQDLAEGMDYLPGRGTSRDENNVVANIVGIVNISGRAINLIPLSGTYLPKRGDTIVGQVADLSFSGWRIDINCAYSAMMNVRDGTSDFVQRGADLSQYYQLNDYVVAKIINVTSQKLVDLTMKGPGLQKIRGGRIIYVNTNKVPRIIGKQGSMVSMIKEATGCRIVVGQNGVVWLSGDPGMEITAEKAVRKIEQESHIPGLTDRVKKFLDNEIKKVKSK